MKQNTLNKAARLGLQRQKNFTLIELLVVVAIIGILASIMLPSLQKARDAAILSVCMSNLKQTSSANALYLKDYNYRLPAASTNVLINYKAWAGKAGTESTYTGGDRILNPYYGFEGIATTTTTELAALSCPGDKGTHEGAFPRANGAFDAMGTSYMYNSSANNNNGALGIAGRFVATIDNPSKVIYASDFSFNAYFINYKPFHEAYWHNRKENAWGSIVFIDGSVKFRQALPTNTYGDDWSFVWND